MQIAYGPAGLKGVSQLMAVGDGEFDETATERAVTVGAFVFPMPRPEGTAARQWITLGPIPAGGLDVHHPARSR